MKRFKESSLTLSVQFFPKSQYVEEKEFCLGIYDRIKEMKECSAAEENTLKTFPDPLEKKQKKSMRMDEMEGIKETDETEILAEERGQHESNLTFSDKPVHLQSCLNRGRITGLVLSPLTSPSH